MPAAGGHCRSYYRTAPNGRVVGPMGSAARGRGGRCKGQANPTRIAHRKGGPPRRHGSTYLHCCNTSSRSRRVSVRLGGRQSARVSEGWKLEVWRHDYSRDTSSHAYQVCILAMHIVCILARVQILARKLILYVCRINTLVEYVHTRETMSSSVATWRLGALSLAGARRP